MGPSIEKIDRDGAAYLCAQDVLHAIGLSQAKQDEFWASDEYTDIALSLLDKCAELVKWYGSGLHVERMAKRSEAIFEMANQDWAYLPATGAEILFRTKGGFIFSDHILNSLLRAWMGQPLVFFIDPPDPLYNHPARSSDTYKANIEHERDMGLVKEGVDGLGRLVIETSVQTYDGSNGVRYSIFDQDGRLVESGYPDKYAGPDDKESVTKIEYDYNGNEIRRIDYGDGELYHQEENQFDPNGKKIISIQTNHRSGQPETVEYHYDPNDGMVTNVIYLWE